MFSDNQRISKRQLGRQTLLGLSGTFLLFLPQIPIMYGWNGLLGIFLGTLLFWVYLFFMIRRIGISSCARERRNKITVILYESYLIVTGAYLVRMISQIIVDFLLPEYQVWVIGIVVIVVALLGTGNDVQRRGRLGEAACVVVVGGLFLLVFLAALQIRVPIVGAWSIGTLGGVLDSMYQTFCSFSIFGILPFFISCVERPQSAVTSLVAATGMASLLAAGALIVLAALFGIHGAQAKEIPITSLMSAVNVPGKFLDRFDAIWMLFFLFSLLFSVGTILHYGQRVLEKETPMRIRMLIVLLVLVLAFANDVKNFLLVWYPWCVRYIYMPLFVVLSFWKVRRKG